MAKIIGIDLGTTNSVVSVMEGGTAHRDLHRGRWAIVPVGGGLQ